MKSHKDLNAWKIAMDLVVEVYMVTQLFPKHELYGLTNQMRRAAISVPSNISEGAGRKHTKEFIQFIFIALGSLSELETQAIISKRLDLLSEPQFIILDKQILAIRMLLRGLIKKLSTPS
jgi:four helix bundle protein